MSRFPPYYRDFSVTTHQFHVKKLQPQLHGPNPPPCGAGDSLGSYPVGDGLSKCKQLSGVSGVPGTYSDAPGVHSGVMACIQRIGHAFGRKLHTRARVRSGVLGV